MPREEVCVAIIIMCCLLIINTIDHHERRQKHVFGANFHLVQNREQVAFPSCASMKFSKIACDLAMLIKWVFVIKS